MAHSNDSKVIKGIDFLCFRMILIHRTLRGSRQLVFDIFPIVIHAQLYSIFFMRTNNPFTGGLLHPQNVKVKIFLLS